MIFKKLGIIKENNLRRLLRVEGVRRVDKEAFQELITLMEYEISGKLPLIRENMLISGRKIMKKQDLINLKSKY